MEPQERPRFPQNSKRLGALGGWSLEMIALVKIQELVDLTLRDYFSSQTNLSLMDLAALLHTISSLRLPRCTMRQVGWW